MANDDGYRIGKNYVLDAVQREAIRTDPLARCEAVSELLRGRSRGLTPGVNEVALLRLDDINLLIDLLQGKV